MNPKEIQHKIKKYTTKLQSHSSSNSSSYYQKKLRYYHQLNQYGGTMTVDDFDDDKNFDEAMDVDDDKNFDEAVDVDDELYGGGSIDINRLYEHDANSKKIAKLISNLMYMADKNPAIHQIIANSTRNLDTTSKAVIMNTTKLISATKDGVSGANLLSLIAENNKNIDGLVNSIKIASKQNPSLFKPVYDTAMTIEQINTANTNIIKGLMSARGGGDIQQVLDRTVKNLAEQVHNIKNIVKLANDMYVSPDPNIAQNINKLAKNATVSIDKEVRGLQQILSTLK